MNYLAALLITAAIFSNGNAFANGKKSDGFEADTIIVEVKGNDTDARFEPVVVKVQPGDVIRFMVREGLHTVTAYHPENRRPLRMPEDAASFDSGPLQQGETWVLQIHNSGVFDYFCRPHEKMGHAGRIISGPVDNLPDYPDERIPQIVLKKLNSKTTNFLTKQNQ